MFLISTLLLLATPLKTQQLDESNHIRINLLGYLSNDDKIAIVGSEENLAGQLFYLVQENDPEKIVFKGTVSVNRGNQNTPFKYNLPCDFSSFNKPGEYKILLANGTLSHSFSIGDIELYQNALSTVLDFFHSQRCGDTDPILHKPCHLNDSNAAIDVSGGWHDAGDYIKYMITTTFAVVEMLTAADYAYSYGFDNAMDDSSPKNGIPDLLDESRIGLDWILKMTADYKSGNYYYQVSGEEDHEGWRLPEDDDLARDKGKTRSLHKGWGGNILGRSIAALAIASRIYKQYDLEFASNCLERAEGLFGDRENYTNSQPAIPVHFYNEREWLDDMVLGASELYLATGKSEYSNYAKENLKKLKGSDIGWNGSDYLAFASCYKAKIEDEFCLDKMKNSLEDLVINSNNDPYYLSSGYAWGTTAIFTADGQKAIMYYYLTSDSSYLNLAIAQRDYLMGRNNWGISFVVGLGSVYPINAHSQLNNLAGLQRGAVVGGPAEKSSWERVFPNLKIEDDRYEQFQSEIIYYDNQEDYYCNEVALDYAAPAVFLFLHNISQSLRQNSLHKKNN